LFVRLVHGDRLQAVAYLVAGSGSNGLEAADAPVGTGECRISQIGDGVEQIAGRQGADDRRHRPAVRGAGLGGCPDGRDMAMPPVRLGPPDAHDLKRLRHAHDLLVPLPTAYDRWLSMGVVNS